MNHFALIAAAGYIAPRQLRTIKDTHNNFVAVLMPFVKNIWHSILGILQDYEIENLKIICRHPDMIESVNTSNIEPKTPIQIMGSMMGLYDESIGIKRETPHISNGENLGLGFVLGVPLMYIAPLKN